MRRSAQASGQACNKTVTLAGVALLILALGLQFCAGCGPLSTSPMTQNETRAILLCREVLKGQNEYSQAQVEPTYAARLTALQGYSKQLAALTEVTLEEGLTGYTRRGYQFVLKAGVDQHGRPTWSFAGRPEAYCSTGVRSFYIDQTGVQRAADIGGGFGGSEMPTIWKSRQSGQ